MPNVGPADSCGLLGCTFQTCCLLTSATVFLSFSFSLLKGAHLCFEKKFLAYWFSSLRNYAGLVTVSPRTASGSSSGSDHELLVADLERRVGYNKRAFYPHSFGRLCE